MGDKNHIPIRLHAGLFQDHRTHGQRHSIGFPETDLLTLEISDRVDLFRADEDPWVGIEEATDEKNLLSPISGL